MNPERVNGASVGVRLGILVGALAAGVGGLVLVGWTIDSPVLKSVLPGWVAIKPNTALAFVLTGAAMVSAACRGSAASMIARLAWLCGGIAGLIGLLTMGEYALGWNPGLDEWLFREPPGAVGTSHPGRMAPDTALCFVLLAAGLGLGGVRNRPRYSIVVTAVLGAMTTAVALTAIASYFAGVFGPYGWGDQTIMAVPTALVFIFMGLTMAVTAWLDGKAPPMAAGNGESAALSRASWMLLLVFLMLAAGIIATGITHYRTYEKRYRGEIEHQLTAIAELKIRELTQWRRERLGDAGVLLNNAAFIALARRVLAQPSDDDARRQVLDWLGKYPTHLGYDQVRLMDDRTVTRLAVPGGLEPADDNITRGVAEVLRSGEAALQDFHRHGQGISLTVLVPLLDSSADRRPLGAVALRIDPAHYLYPLIQHWPTPSPTAETLLVRREGDEVVFLNELRHHPGSALHLRRSLREPQLPAAWAAAGFSRVSEGVDYRGIRVLAATQSIPNSDWMMVAKVDWAEIIAPLHREAWLTGGVGFLLMLATAFAGIALWRQRHAVLLRHDLALERKHKLLAERLAMVTRHANDIILLLDETGRIVEGQRARDRHLRLHPQRATTVATGRSPDCGGRVQLGGATPPTPRNGGRRVRNRPPTQGRHVVPGRGQRPCGHNRRPSVHTGHLPRPHRATADGGAPADQAAPAGIRPGAFA